MKYLLVFLVILVSCGRDIPSSYAIPVVDRIVSLQNGKCKYILERGRMCTPFSGGPAIVDSCGKFQIGDTIKFNK